MGLLSALLGHASEADVADIEENIRQVLAEDEKVERAFALVRDLLIFTNRRFILVDRQGLTGRKTSYQSIPYRAVTSFTVETAGHMDMESELTIWVSGGQPPLQKTFARGQTIYDVQKALATYVGR